MTTRRISTETTRPALWSAPPTETIEHTCTVSFGIALTPRELDEVRYRISAMAVQALADVLAARRQGGAS